LYGPASRACGAKRLGLLTHTWLDLVRRAEAQLRTVPRPSPDAQPDLPFVCSRLKIGGRVVRTVSTVMRFDAAVEVTLAELRVEMLFPADEESDAFFQSLRFAGSGLGIAATGSYGVS
jgi:hypothetical protein